MLASIGRIVHYRLTLDDSEAINRRRDDARDNPDCRRKTSPGTGFVAHVGNTVVAGDVVPVIVTAAWQGDLINGQAILDGNDSLWLMSKAEGDSPGSWFWPPKVTGDSKKLPKAPVAEDPPAAPTETVTTATDTVTKDDVAEVTAEELIGSTPSGPTEA